MQMYISDVELVCSIIIKTKIKQFYCLLNLIFVKLL